MINFQSDSLSTATPDGVLTLWGTFQHFQDYIYDNYGWKQIDTQDSHEARIRRIIQRAVPDHNTTGIDQYPENLPQTIRTKMQTLGKDTGGEYSEDTLKQFEYLVRYILETAETHYLRNAAVPSDSGARKTGILLGHSDLPAVRHYLYPDEELSLLKIIIPQLPHRGEARLILLQIASGMRENECCGTNWSMLEKDPVTSICRLIMPQTTVLGKNELKLGGKNANAPRVIVISDLVYVWLLDAKHQLMAEWIANGHTEEAFDDLPLGCKGDDFQKRCSTKDMTEYANLLFNQIGIRRDELAVLSADLVARYHEERDAGLYADVQDYRSPTCYILRRSNATHMVALGYSSADRQYCMGHRIDDPTVDRRIYSEANKQIALSAKASLRPLLNPVNISEYYVGLGETCSVHHHKEVLIVPPGAASVLLRITADEPGDQIDIAIEQIDGEPCEYQLITHMLPASPDVSITSYPAEVNVTGYYHDLYATQIEAYTQWLTSFFGES